MGMTIEKAIEFFDGLECCTPQAKDAKDVAIDTMRKYQKIEQILSDWINDDSVGMSDYWMGRIKEVIEDGKID